MTPSAERILAAVDALGVENPVVLIDGRSGAGKTTLVAELVANWPLWRGVQLLALDSVYPGWDGLAEGSRYAGEVVLDPLRRGEQGVWRRWDWERERRAESHPVDPWMGLVVEGSGILTAANARLADLTVWLEAPEELRKERALRRDGEAYRPHWDRWAAQETAHLALNRPADLATLRLDAVL